MPRRRVISGACRSYTASFSSPERAGPLAGPCSRRTRPCRRARARPPTVRSGRRRAPSATPARRRPTGTSRPARSTPRTAISSTVDALARGAPPPSPGSAPAHGHRDRVRRTRRRLARSRADLERAVARAAARRTRAPCRTTRRDTPGGRVVLLGDLAEHQPLLAFRRSFRTSLPATRARCRGNAP